MMKVLVCGGRNFNDRMAIHVALTQFYEQEFITCLIHGDCRGVDRICGDWAQANGIPVMVFPANWNYYGRAAGPKRNNSMVEFGRPDYLIAFDGGNGTNHMIKTAKNNGIQVWQPKGGYDDSVSEL